MIPANGNANPNNQPTDKGWFCPTCGAADVTASGLAGGAAKCNVCTWTGRVEELATFRFTHDMGSPEEVFSAFFKDMRNVLTQQFAVAVGQLLIKWGFMDAPDKKNNAQVVRTLARYMGAVSQAVCKAIIAERQAIEREKHGEPTDTPTA
jgi:hypothetical protein